MSFTLIIIIIISCKKEGVGCDDIARNIWLTIQVKSTPLCVAPRRNIWSTLHPHPPLPTPLPQLSWADMWVTDPSWGHPMRLTLSAITLVTTILFWGICLGYRQQPEMFKIYFILSGHS